MMKYLLFSLFCTLLGLPAYAHVQLLTPKGGDTLVAGTTFTITWKILIHHDTQNWDVLFSSDGGQTFDTIKADIDANLLSYDWTVPDIETSQARIQIVQDNTGMDYNDISGDFTILNTTSATHDIPWATFSVYPNPAAAAVTVKGPAGSDLEIIDAAGTYIESRKMTGDKLDVSLADLPEGLYYICLINGEEHRISKLIKS